MWSKIDTYIKKYKLLNSNELYLVALSGGADSVALLLLLKEDGFNVHAAHCNFHLRGAESDRDEAFCETLCKQLDIPLHRAHFDTRTYADLHKVSIEMAARELRYGWFAQLCKDLGAAGVCVAHHRDDSVETVLLNLVRGTGLRGLTGIKARSEQTITCGQNTQEHSKLVVLRPFLGVSRAEIEAFLAERGQKYVTDSTNLEADVLRNKIRLQVLPMLRELNPAVYENIQRTAENLEEAQEVLDAVISQYKNSNMLELSELKRYYSSEYIIFEWLKNYGFNGKQVRQILDAECGGIVSSSMGYDVLKDRSRLIVEVTMRSLKRIVVPEEGTYVVEEFGGTADNSVFGRGTAENIRFRVRKCAVYISTDPHVATLDAAKVHFPLTIRRVEKGDWMIPYGMTGRKLLSDMMTDSKMNVFEKRRQLVIVDAQGVIVWLVGVRVDARMAVSETTTVVLECLAEKSGN
jgi:tRNA(Ile)-lysidine synthase